MPQEIDDALNQARKELATRFDFEGISSIAEILSEKGKITLTAEDSIPGCEACVVISSGDWASGAWTCEIWSS